MGQTNKREMRFYHAFLLSAVAHSYITCNDYYDIFDENDPIVCALLSDTPANRRKFTELEHEIVITDNTGLQQNYPMPWNDETGQWELSTSSNMDLTDLYTFQYKEYNAEMHTTCGYDLVETKFTLIAEQPLSPSMMDAKSSTLNNALLADGFIKITEPDDNVAWKIRQVDCSETVYYHSGAVFGYKYAAWTSEHSKHADTINWYRHPTNTIINHITITPSGNLIIIDADGQITKYDPSEVDTTSHMTISIDDIEGSEVDFLGTASDCLTLNEYVFFGTSDTVYRINNNVKNNTDISFNKWSTVNDIVDIKQTDMAELVVLHKSSDQSCFTVLSELMSVSSENCVPSIDIDDNDKLFLHDHKALMVVVYGQSGVYYSYDLGCAWTQLTDADTEYIVVNTAGDYMLITLMNGDVQIFAPGATLRTISTGETLPTAAWVWNGEIQHLDGSNEIQTILPDEQTCKRYIDYDGQTEFLLDQDNELSLNFTVKNADGYVTNVAMLVSNGNNIVYRLTSSLNILGELEYKLTVAENSVGNSTGAATHYQTLTASVLHFYLDSGEIGCRDQSVTLVMKITCRQTELLFDYGSAVYQSPLSQLDPREFRTLSYYAALKKEFDELDTETEKLKALLNEIRRDDCVQPCADNVFSEAEALCGDIQSLLKKLNSYSEHQPDLAPKLHTDETALTASARQMRLVRSSSDDSWTTAEIEALTSNAETTINEAEKRLSADPNKKLLKASSSVFQQLPYNYRPPSKYGFAIPDNKIVYRANLNYDLTSYLSGFVVKYAVSKWELLREGLVDRHEKMFGSKDKNDKWNDLCMQNYSVTDTGNSIISESRNFKQYDTNYDNGECLKHVVKITAGQSGMGCIKVEAVLSDGTAIKSNAARLQESNGRTHGYEFIVIEKDKGIPEEHIGSFTEACTSIIQEKYQMSVNKLSELYEKQDDNLDNREFNVDDIYIITLRPGLYHFRLNVPDASFCSLQLDFAYFIGEYKQLDARKSLIITSIVIAISIILITSTFIIDYWPRLQRTRLQSNKMVIVHESGDGGEGGNSTRDSGASAFNRETVKLMMNNQTIDVDEPTMDLSGDYDQDRDSNDDFDDEQMPRKTIMHMIRRRTQHVRPNSDDPTTGSVMDQINF